MPPAARIRPRSQVTTNRLYYQVKPYLPWGLRMVLRRMVARWRRKTFQDVWPINESAGRAPAGWPGWPEGKKFAFVLTHDVEGPAGLAKCRQLMELEMEMGFRSSFNFIPEGDYAVSFVLKRSQPAFLMLLATGMSPVCFSTLPTTSRNTSPL